MANSGLIVYAIFAVLLFWFWMRVRQLKFDEILRRSADEHHHVNAVLAKHPKGGTWHEFSAWMKDNH